MDNSTHLVSSSVSSWKSALPRPVGVAGDPYLAAGLVLGYFVLGLGSYTWAIWSQRMAISSFYKGIKLCTVGRYSDLTGIQNIYGFFKPLISIDAANVITALALVVELFMSACNPPDVCHQVFFAWLLFRHFGVLLHVFNALACLFYLDHPQQAAKIYKYYLRQAKQPENISAMTRVAFEGFKDVEKKAENEEGPEIKDVGPISISKSFNNRGLFGFIQVAKIAFKKMRGVQKRRLIKDKKKEVEAKFDFFEWYLTYSKPDMTTLEPHYFWKDVALCYKYYTNKTASESSSFPGLLDCLNQGLFLSKERRAALEEVEKTVSDLEKIQGVLKRAFEENTDDVKVAERYILSNIILSNKMPDSPRLTSVTELKTIIHRFLNTEVGQGSSEFYLLVLLLFWPEEQDHILQHDNEEVQQQATQEMGGEAAQLPADLIFVPDFEKYVTFMEKAFERYAKYLRGRYLLPLFFLGKGSGLSKWIHKSKLDAIVEQKVDTELLGEIHENNINKTKRINEIWQNGEVWQIPEIQDILLPVAAEPLHSHIIPDMLEDQAVLVCAGGKKVKAFTEFESDALAHRPMLVYLGFTIRHPVVFKVADSCTK
ncbi:hypothetical protein Q5P01_002432 [Channa striata]|uniref:Uncharacterized protein n=1 Tax=Channa striata TaxID=64152 RepID=A0AA88NUA7_CHASR|nr:hypothetical protein Q5P01_002432 [Channa striata]